MFTPKHETEYVRWSVFVFLVSILIGLLGIIWASVSSIQVSVGDIKIDAAVTRTKVEVLEQAVNSGNKSTSILGKFQELISQNREVIQ